MLLHISAEKQPCGRNKELGKRLKRFKNRLKCKIQLNSSFRKSSLSRSLGL